MLAFMRMTIAVLAMGFGLLAASTACAEFKPVKPTKEWIGSGADHGEGSEETICISNAKDLAIVWKTWNVAGSVPKVDFTKELVIASMTRANAPFFLSMHLNEDGDLTVNPITGAQIVPGFRYMIATIDRAGVKSVDGKAVTK